LRQETPWHRNEERESDITKRAIGATSDAQDVLAFDRNKSEGLEAATLVLWGQSDGYRVTNIVPSTVGDLGYSKYNALLQDFERIAAPVVRQKGFSSETTANLETIDDWFPPNAAQALQRFSTAANKSTGSSHPLDRERWFQFLIQAHTDSGRFDSDLLDRWRIEVEGWSEDIATKLVIEYEFGIELLRKYDGRRP
jgi:hypothetical protein